MAAKKSATSMKLESVLDLNQASALKKELVAARGKNIVIDASGVERVGVQCIQVLVAASRACRRDGTRLSGARACRGPDFRNAET